MSDDDVPWSPDEPVELPIDGTLDLHTFHPRDVPALLEEYLAACRERGILDVRVIHGKGTGTLRRRVHALIQGMPGVESFRSADAFDGGWGATWVRLRPLPGGERRGAQSSQK